MMHGFTKIIICFKITESLVSPSISISLVLSDFTLWIHTSEDANREVRKIFRNVSALILKV
jgi:hypothetical protein